jgi:mannose-1-phosphate guanylyltransferase
MENNQYCILMSGGLGSRFWPLSTKQIPKQFIDILGTGKSMLRQTYERFSKMFDDDKIFIVTNRDFVDLTKAQIPEISDNNILVEPVSKNTAVCIAYAHHRIKAFDPNAEFIISPTDHIMLNTDNFYELIENSFEFVDHKDIILTMGLKPLNPHPGYGYIQYKSDSINKNIYKIKTFVEKPNEEMAQLFVDSDEFLWNTGIMVANVLSMDEAYKKHMPQIYTLFEKYKDAFNTDSENAVIEEIYPQCDKISVDYGIMEKAENSYVQIANFDWTDLGTWSALYEIMDKDEHNNFVANKKTILYDTENCIINSLNEKNIVIDGLKDYIVADSGTSLLIIPKKNESKIKSIVNRIKLESSDLH